MLELVTGIVVAAVALALVLEPLLRSGSREATAARYRASQDDFVDIEEADSPKLRALRALREIEFDRATGKLSASDYESLKHKYAESAVVAIRAERAQDGTPGAAQREEDAAEAMIARVKSKQPTTCPTCRHELEPGSIFCSSCGRSLIIADAPARCWVCGEDLPAGGKFCADCGSPIPEDVAVE